MRTLWTNASLETSISFLRTLTLGLLAAQLFGSSQSWMVRRDENCVKNSWLRPRALKTRMPRLFFSGFGDGFADILLNKGIFCHFWFPSGLQVTEKKIPFVTVKASKIQLSGREGQVVQYILFNCADYLSTYRSISSSQLDSILLVSCRSSLNGS